MMTMILKRIWISTVIVAIICSKTISTQDPLLDSSDLRTWDSDEFERQSLLFPDDDTNLINDVDDPLVRNLPSSIYPSSNNYKSAKKLLLKPLRYPLTSPYQVIPGSYQLPKNDQYYGYNIPNITYNAKSIYTNYLVNNNAGMNYYYGGKNCQQKYGYNKQIVPADLNQAFAYAEQGLQQRYPEYSNQRNYRDVDRKEIESTKMELVSEYFARFKCLDKYQLGVYLPTIPVNYQQKNMDLSCSPYWNEKYQCNSYRTSKYRTLDGSCNNLRSPYWGRSFSCHIRLLPPDYGDGLYAMRLSKSGHSLPGARTISNYVTQNRDLRSVYTSLMVSFGQFINHDMTSTANYRQTTSKQIDCCKQADPKCVAIMMDSVNDYVETVYKTKCMNFIRSQPCALCKLGPREQMNKATSFLDGSAIYGSSLNTSNSLRSFQKGQLLAIADAKGNPILPFDPTLKPCQPSIPGLSCFKAGDERANQQPLLLTMQTIWLRNHNNHAMRLSQINPHWNDEQLYQEARRLTIAEIQHITYNEYLPIILGPLLMDYYRLYSKPNYTYSYYESFTDPSSWNEFVTAASRYGHSQISDFYTLGIYGNLTKFPLKESFSDPTLTYSGMTEELLRGLIGEHAHTVDPYYADVVKQYMMKNKTQPHGFDLVAVNIQRGRDHGLPGYVHYLKACFNYDAKSWNDLEKFIPRKTLEKFKRLYNSIEDIDLYIAGVSERHFIDASVGPTFGCLAGIQFYHLKFGDRYFYEHGQQSGSFLPAQLANIKQAATLSRIICRNARNQQYVQANPLLFPSKLNPQLDCRTFPDIDYMLWKE
uniref:Peroxidase-like n=1 Tax=Dermatophagoides pteronyssinus TaxID=6956 RepID=A0A6P6YFI6_DERPT|nr:peroxidase-like [Dermatophagoides pteronyssinus]